MIQKENLDDVILLDQEYNIQGMTGKLYDWFKFNPNIFQDCDVPFWLICKEFIHHYQTFMANNPSIKYSYVKKPDMSINKSMVKSGISTTNEESTQPITTKTTQQNQKDNNNNTELDFEINENADVQWDIVIPPFFKLYVEQENKQQNFISLTMGIQREESEHMSSDVIMENSHEDDDNYAEETNKMIHNTVDSSTGSKSLTQSYGGQDHDKEFQNQIGRYRPFFTSQNNNNFNELNKILDKLNEGNDQVYRFVISFSQIRYGEGKMGYVIRCIDNKDDVDLSSDEKLSQKSMDKDKGNKFNFDNKEGGDNPLNMHQGVFDRKKYLQGLQEVEEQTEEDVTNIKNRLENFHKLVFEDDKIKDSVDNFHQEILWLSRVLGANAATVLDENASQSSSGSQYANSITKKSRVQEIKSHLMTNVSEFYTLKLIKYLFLFFMLLTVLFGVIYCIQYENYINLTKIIDQIHTSSSNLLFYYSECLSIITSFKGMYKIINDIEDNGDILFNTYLSDVISDENKEEEYNNYIQREKLILKKFYAYLQDEIAVIEYNYTKQISDEMDRFAIWDDVDEGFHFNEEEQNTVNFIVSISQTLSYINQLMNTTDYNFPGKCDIKQIAEINYIIEKIIESTYKTDIDKLVVWVKNMTRISSDENNNNQGIWTYLFIVYCLITLIFAGFYALFLFLTSRNMEDGLFVISKIDPPWIDETIKTIDMFNKTILSKFRQKGEKDSQPSGKNKNNTWNETGMSTMSAKSKEEEEKEASENEEVSYYDPNIHKKLSILSYSYLQTFCMLAIFLTFMIPLILETRSLCINANKFLIMKDYFVSDLLKTSLNILNIKIKITSDEIKDNFWNYEYSIDQEMKTIVTSQINKYIEWNEFYKNKYLNSICWVIFEDEETINKCKVDQVISEYCDVNNLLGWIEENIYNIHKDLEIKGIDFNSYEEFSNINFKKWEYIQTKYFWNIPETLRLTFEKSFNVFSNTKTKNMIIIIIIMIVVVWAFSWYIILHYIQTLIHLLLISRCIFKIIPTKVINKTKDLENWIDDKY